MPQSDHVNHFETINIELFSCNQFHRSQISGLPGIPITSIPSSVSNKIILVKDQKIFNFSL
jgi:hypothetical protein